MVFLQYSLHRQFNMHYHAIFKSVVPDILYYKGEHITLEKPKKLSNTTPLGRTGAEC